MTVMEMTQKELTRAIAEGLSSVVKERCDQIDSRVNALAESLSRRLDALEKQAGPTGKLYVTDVDHATKTVTFDTEDPKDLLIRDLMTWLNDHHVYPYVIWNDTKNGFRDRAEKLGVKL